jgi:hypothetical protein
MGSKSFSPQQLWGYIQESEMRPYSNVLIATKAQS